MIYKPGLWEGEGLLCNGINGCNGFNGRFEKKRLRDALQCRVISSAGLETSITDCYPCPCPHLRRLRCEYSPVGWFSIFGGFNILVCGYSFTLKGLPDSTLPGATGYVIERKAAKKKKKKKETNKNSTSRDAVPTLSP